MERKRRHHTLDERTDITQVFSRDFFTEDPSLAVAQPAEYLAASYAASELITKGAEITIFLETHYPDLLTEEPEHISGRMGTTVVAAYNVLRKKDNLPPLKLTERHRVVFSFSRALEALDREENKTGKP